mmetsp:Transcript_33937/g.101265  ORF Transcript_33937/g.101265 Transcript_33937/m.101265 type:complete len:323 (-) Transcript_33937:990-1958(-)
MIRPRGSLLEDDGPFKGEGHVRREHGVEHPKGHGEEVVRAPVEDGRFGVGHLEPEEAAHHADGPGLDEVHLGEDGRAAVLHGPVDEDGELSPPRRVERFLQGDASSRPAHQTLSAVVAAHRGGSPSREGELVVDFRRHSLPVPCRDELLLIGHARILRRRPQRTLFHPSHRPRRLVVVPRIPPASAVPVVPERVVHHVVVILLLRGAVHHEQIHPVIGGVVPVGAGHAEASGVLQRSRGSAKVRDVPIREEHELVEPEEHGRRRLVDARDDGLARALGEAFEDAHERDRRGGIETGGGLIEQHNGRIREELRTDVDALLLAS